MSIAIVVMVNNTDRTHRSIMNVSLEDACPKSDLEISTSSVQSNLGNFDWNPATEGLILSSYFYGFTASQIIGGRLAEIFGAKIVCGAGILASSIATLFTPISAKSITVICGIRILVGGFGGLIFPAFYNILMFWIPENERSTAIAVAMSLGNLGSAIFMPLMSYLCGTIFLGGWPSSFYVTAIFGFLWSFVWFVYMTDLPEQNLMISENELEIILKRRRVSVKNKDSAPWAKILCSSAVWASVVTKATYAFGYYIVITDLPLYLESVLHLPIGENGIFNAAVYLVPCIPLYFSGKFSDLIISHSNVSVTVLRKVMQGIAMLGPAIALICVPLSGCNEVQVIALILTAMFFAGFISGGELPIVTEFAPNYSGTVFGFTNIFPCLVGIIVPMFIGFILNDNIHSRSHWNMVFNSSAAIYTFGFIYFTIFGTSKPTEWGSSQRQVS